MAQDQLNRGDCPPPLTIRYTPGIQPVKQRQSASGPVRRRRHFIPLVSGPARLGAPGRPLYSRGQLIRHLFQLLPLLQREG